MSFDLWILYLVATVFICLTPGPNSLLAVTNGVRYGVRKTMYSTLGCMAGGVLIMAVSVSGLGIIMATSEIVFNIIKWAGAMYLVYLGIMLFRSKAEFKAVTAGHTENRSGISLFIQGFTIIATNPKALLFFTAFLPQFVNQSTPLLPQFVVLAGTFVLLEFAFEIFLAAASRQIASFGSGKRLSIFNKITGGVFIGAGAYLLTMERT